MTRDVTVLASHFFSSRGAARRPKATRARWVLLFLSIVLFAGCTNRPEGYDSCSPGTKPPKVNCTDDFDIAEGTFGDMRIGKGSRIRADETAAKYFGLPQDASDEETLEFMDLFFDRGFPHREHLYALLATQSSGTGNLLFLADSDEGFMDTITTTSLRLELGYMDFASDVTQQETWKESDFVLTPILATDMQPAISIAVVMDYQSLWKCSIWRMERTISLLFEILPPIYEASIDKSVDAVCRKTELTAQVDMLGNAVTAPANRELESVLFDAVVTAATGLASNGQGAYRFAVVATPGWRGDSGSDIEDVREALVSQDVVPIILSHMSISSKSGMAFEEMITLVAASNGLFFLRADRLDHELASWFVHDALTRLHVLTFDAGPEIEQVRLTYAGPSTSTIVQMPLKHR